MLLLGEGIISPSNWFRGNNSDANMDIMALFGGIIVRLTAGNCYQGQQKHGCRMGRENGSSACDLAKIMPDLWLLGLCGV